MRLEQMFDYAQLHKVYGAVNDGESRYSPATCIGCDMKTVCFLETLTPSM